MRRIVLALGAAALAWLPTVAPAFEVADAQKGDAAIAARYAAWAVAAAEEGRWPEAETALERAADFSDASSDVSYLLALARLKLDRPAGAALAAVRTAIEADRWDRYGREAAALVEASILIRLRRFDEALDVLKGVGNGSERTYLRCRALADGERFRSAIRDALEAYPEDPRFAALMLDRASLRPSGDGERALVDTVLARLPFLLALDPSLAYRAAPFIRDPEERRRLIGAYRAVSAPAAAALPQALELGLVDGSVAVEELFSAATIDVSVVRSVWALLREDAERATFMAAFAAFGGSLTEDRDGDGYVETAARYRGGSLVSSAYDADQDGLPELEIEYADGVPVRGSAAVSAEISAESAAAAESKPAATLAAAAERTLARIEWARYPSVASVSYGESRYVPAPTAFPFAPVRLVALVDEGRPSSPRFPKDDPSVSRLSVRSLVSFASVVERPGSFMEGAVERVELVRGIPRRATETVNGRVVSVLEFSRGRPAFRKIDLDLDGRMETTRRLRASAVSVGLVWEEPIESTESDWDGDGVSEYAEVHFKNGDIERSWDMDGDGKRERVVRERPGEVNAIR